MKKIVHYFIASAFMITVLSLTGCAVEPMYPRSYAAPRYAPPVVVWGSPYYSHRPFGWGHFEGGW